MPVLPTIADVWRVTFNWNPAHGCSPRNVLHFYAPGKTDADIVSALNGAWDSAMWDSVQQDWSFNTVDLLALDGSSATISAAVTAQGSLVSGDWIFGQAAVISLQTGQRGSRGRGRIYLGPLPESKLSVGLINNTTALALAWTNFFGDMASAGVFPGVASYTHADFNTLVSHRADSVPGSQRRRTDAVR